MTTKRSADWLLQNWLHNADEVTGAPIIIDSVHHEVHEGEMFHASHTSASIADDANLDILLTVGAKEAHATWEVFAGGQVTVSLYEAPTVSGGTASVAAPTRRCPPLSTHRPLRRRVR